MQDALADSVWGLWSLSTALQAGALGVVLLISLAVLRPGPRWTAALTMLGLLSFLVPPHVWIELPRPKLVLGPTGGAGDVRVRPILALLAATHALGLAVGLLILGRSTVVLRRTLGNARRITEGPLHSALRRAAASAGIATPRLFLTPGGSPAAIGIVRPAVLLPEGVARALDAGGLRMVLAHEAAHIARRDPLVAALWTLARSVWFWHPVVWLLAWLHRSASEEACDDAALAHGAGSARDYCRAILHCATQLTNSGHPTGLTAGLGGHPLGTRFRRLLRPRGRLPQRARHRWILATLVASTLLTLPVRLVRFDRDVTTRETITTVTDSHFGIRHESRRAHE